MRAYINNESGSGKTLLASILALLYSELNPNNDIYANFHINLYDVKTDKPKVVYTKFALLPFSRIEKGNCLIILDDFYAIKNANYYSGLLAAISRKTLMEVILTIQYYTDLTKRVRKLCQYELKPELTNLDIFGKITKESRLFIEWYNEATETLMFETEIPNLYNLIFHGKLFKYSYIPENLSLYNTNETVEFGTESKLINEIAEFSIDYPDIEMNASIVCKNRTDMKRLIRDVCRLKGIENRLEPRKK